MRRHLRRAPIRPTARVSLTEKGRMLLELHELKSKTNATPRRETNYVAPKTER